MLPHCQNWWVPPSRAGACPRRRDAPSTILDVGAGIPAGPGWAMVWARQGCRALRWGGTKKAAVRHPLWGGDGGLAALPRDCAICGWRFGTIEEFAPCAARLGALPPGPRDFGLPAVRWQEWSARNSASGQGVAEKARRAPQTHGRWVALTRKKSSKTFIFFFFTGGENPRK